MISRFRQSFASLRLSSFLKAAYAKSRVLANAVSNRLSRVHPWHVFGFALYVIIAIRNAWMSDDAFIALRAVSNLLQGHGLVSNAGERVQAFTDPLWVLLMIPFQWFSGEIYFSAVVVSLIVSAIAAWLLITRIARPINALLVALLLSFSRSATDYATSGLENPLIHMLLVIVLLVYIQEQTTKKSTFWLFFASALLCTTRMDTVLLVAPLLAHHLWTSGVRKSLLPACLGLVPFLGWLVFSTVYYGFPFPNTAYAKMSTGISPRLLGGQGLSYWIDGTMRDPITILAIIGVLISALLIRKTRAIMPMLGVLLYGAYVIKVGGDFMSGRFFTAMFFVSLFVLGHWILRKTPQHQSAVPVVFAALVVLSAPFNPLHSHPEKCFVPPSGIVDERGCYEEHTALFRNLRKIDGKWKYQTHPYWQLGVELKEKGERVVFDNRHGLAGCAAGPSVHIVDGAALTDPFLARSPNLVTHTKWRIGHFYRHIPPGYIDTLKTGTPLIENPCLQRYYDKLSVVVKGPIFTWERFKNIYALNTGKYDYLMKPECSNP